MKPAKVNYWWLIALVIVTALIWGVQYNRLNPANWSVPVEYGFDSHGGDSHLMLGWMKAAADGDFLPFWSKTVPRLGAPYIANWNDFPMPDEILIFVLGMLARVFGLMQASNLAMLLGPVTSALAFYGSCRLLRYNRLWSWVGAVLFAFTYFVSFRGFGHLMLGYIYTIPLALVCVWFIGGSKRLAWGGKHCRFCLVTAVVLGLSNPYNLNMYCQLIGFALLFQFFTQRRKQNLLVGAACLGLAALAFIAVNLDTLGYRVIHGKNPESAARAYYESELFGLKLIELFVPPPDHHVESFAAIGRKYAGAAFVKGELFAPYLGLIGLIGLLWIAMAAMKLVSQRRRGKLPAHGPQAVWIILYSTTAGFNCLLALGGLTIFRASNRFSVFLSALALLFLVSRLSVISRAWKPGTRLIIAMLALLIGLYDQLPRAKQDAETQSIARMVQADRDFVARMEALLPPGAKVFDLPVMVFPEATAKHQLLAYELIRPYLFSKNLHFSYGDNYGRPRGYWQWELEKMPPQKMVAELEKYGFAALYLNRRAFPDQAEELLKQLAAAGKNQIIEDDLREQVSVVLAPSPTPELPPSAFEATVSYLRNWVLIEGMPPDRQVWSGGDAQLSFYNPGKTFCVYKFKCAVGSLNRRHVSIFAQGREIWSAQLNPGQAVPIELTIDAKPGDTLVDIKTDEPPVAASNQARTPVAVVLINLRVIPVK